jgi:hypothetical protein
LAASGVIKASKKGHRRYLKMITGQSAFASHIANTVAARIRIGEKARVKLIRDSPVLSGQVERIAPASRT